MASYLLVPYEAQREMMDKWLEAGDNNLLVHLLSTDTITANDPNIQWGDLSAGESTYDGYAPVVVNPPVAYSDTTTMKTITGPMVAGFAGPASGGDATITGAWVGFGGVEDLLIVGYTIFDTPVILPVLGDGISVSVRIRCSAEPPPPILDDVSITLSPRPVSGDPAVVTLAVVDRITGLPDTDFVGNVSIALMADTYLRDASNAYTPGIIDLTGGGPVTDTYTFSGTGSPYPFLLIAIADNGAVGSATI